MPDLRPAVLLDVDGTLLDTNYLHVLAWSAAVQAEPGMMIDEVHVNARGNAVRWNLLRTALPR